MTLACALAISRSAGAEPLPKDRLEPAGLPVLGANSDVGVAFGLLGIVAKFEEGYWPYRWQLQAQWVMSVKQGDDGIEVPLHDDFVRLDLPGLAGGRLRLISDVGFMRVGTVGYHGVGNRSAPATLDDPARPFQYARSSPAARVEARIKLMERLQLLVSGRLSYEWIGIYEDSKLARDAALRDEDGDPFLRGTADHVGALGAVGLLLDTRNHETVPSRGLFHELSLRVGGGGGALYGGATMNARFYFPLIDGRLVLATRALADVLFGAPPFYELSRAGGFTQIEAMGGREGIRGVPLGRYRGDSKLLGDAELRAMLLPFEVLQQRFRLGASAFVDGGRVWSTPELDGPGLGLKYSFGGGPRLQWGESVIIRVDLGYAPSEIGPNRAPPFGFYIEVGQAF